MVEHRIRFSQKTEVIVPSEKLPEGTSVYLAGPNGFAEFTSDSLISLTTLIEHMGGEVLDPWQLTDPKILESALRLSYGVRRRERWKKVNRIIGKNNEDAIRQSTGILACLDGVDVDSGTAAEIGFAYALGKPIIGYRGDFRLSADNEGSIVNLQVQHFITASGGGRGRITQSLANLPEALLQVFGKR